MGNKTILVVEDDVLLAETLSDLLVEADFDPAGPAATAEDAIALVQAGNVDAAILDIRLKGGQSFPVAYALRQRRLPFMFLTATSQDCVPLDLRGERLMGKPFDPSSLVRELHQILLPSTLVRRTA